MTTASLDCFVQVTKYQVLLANSVSDMREGKLARNLTSSTNQLRVGNLHSCDEYVVAVRQYRPHISPLSGIEAFSTLKGNSFDFSRSSMNGCHYPAPTN